MRGTIAEMTTQTGGRRSTTATGTEMRAGLGTGMRIGHVMTTGETDLGSRTGTATGAGTRTGGTDTMIATGTDMTTATGKDMAAAALQGATSARIMGETSCLWPRRSAASSGERLGRVCLCQAGGLQYVWEQVSAVQEVGSTFW